MSRVKNGDLWQAVLDTAHFEYLRAGRARIRRTSGQAKQTAKGVVFTGKGLPDYVGAFRAGDRPVMFVADAKATLESKMYFSQLDDHQAQDLEGFRDMGALTGLLVRLGRQEMFLPWGTIRDDYYAGAKVVPTAKGITFSKGYWLDQVLLWLDGAELAHLYMMSPPLDLEES